MPIIRLSDEIRNNYGEIYKLCKETKQPVYITVNDKGDSAIIDIAVLDELYSRLDLAQKLSVGVSDLNEGKTLNHKEVFSKFK